MLLVIDNYDSFTFNLVQLLGELGADPHVVRNDEVTVDEVRSMGPERIVLSPGPCTPAAAGISVDVVRELGICLETVQLAAEARVPLLGVCLGHQAIGEAFGGRTVRATRIMHGKTAPVRHGGKGIFRDIPSPFEVARYHSLMTDPGALPEVLEPVAWSDAEDDRGEIQGVRHRERPIWGVQFHPESHFSAFGARLLDNFLQGP